MGSKTCTIRVQIQIIFPTGQSKIRASHNLRIARVEDDTSLRKEIFYHLKQAEYQVYAISNGRLLNQRLITEPIDIFILYLALPGEDGLSIMKRIRLSLPKVGIIMMTALGSTFDRVRGKRAPESLVSCLVRKFSDIVGSDANVALKSAWGLGCQLFIAVEIEP